MKNFSRVAWSILLLTLLISPVHVFGQADTDENSISVVGSGIVARVFENLITASEVDADFNLDITGTDNGFTNFCLGEADITNATRPLSISEEELCAQNGVEYTELLLGHDIMTFVAHPELEFVVCLDNSAITSIFAPTGIQDFTDWTALEIAIEETPESTPISLFIPSESSSIYAQLDDFVAGVGLRADVNVTPDENAIIEAVNSTVGALGVVSLNTAQNAENANIIQVSPSLEIGCHDPSAENVESRLYTSANRLLTYVNTASLEKEGLQDFLTFATSEDAATTIADSGFTAPSIDAYATNASALAGDDLGRQFSLELVEFEIPDSIFGQVSVAGSAHLSTYMTALTTQFTTEFPSVQVTSVFGGQIAGIRQLCNGEIDIVAVYTSLTDAQLENCNANNITPVPVGLGSQAVVFVANANDQLIADVEGYDDYSYLSCLTSDQILATWGVTNSETIEDTPRQWNSIDEAFPEIELFIFAPDRGNIYSDIFLTPAEGNALPQQEGTINNRDPLWRAAATANTEGGLTYMSWAEYQEIVEAGQTNIQLVQIDAGDGCVTPSDESISNGEYPYVQSATLLVSQPSLVRPEVQSLIWYMFTDSSYGLLGQNDIQGIALADLTDVREAVQDLFAEAQTAQLSVPDPEATTEPTSETTPEATTEADDE